MGEQTRKKFALSYVIRILFYETFLLSSFVFVSASMSGVSQISMFVARVALCLMERKWTEWNGGGSVMIAIAIK